MVAAFLPLTLETQSHSNLHVHTTVAEPHGCLDAYIFIASRPYIDDHSDTCVLTYLAK